MLRGIAVAGKGATLLLLGLLWLPSTLWAGQGVTGEQVVPPVPG